MKTSVKRFLKVRDSLAALIQASDADSVDDVKSYDEMDEDDQKDATFLAKNLIDLVDGLFPRVGEVKLRTEDIRIIGDSAAQVIRERQARRR